MKRTIVNWKQLGKVLEDEKFKKKPVEISWIGDELESITFETKKLKKEANK